MGNKKRSRREAETNAELETALVAKSEAEVLENREDDELFIVDRSGSKTSRRKIKMEQNRKDMGVLPSATEEHLVRKKMKQILAREKKAEGQKSEAAVVAAVHPLDIWGAEPSEKEIVGVSTNGRRRAARLPGAAVGNRAMKVTGNGLSYNPASVHHQEALAKATALENKRREKQGRDSNGLIKPGISTALASSNGGESSESDSESGSESESDEDDGDNDEQKEKGDSSNKEAKKKKRKEKLSVAQRNKQKAHKALLTQHKQEKALKGIEKQIENLPGILKAVEKGKKQAESKRALIKAAKMRTAEEEKNALTYEESGDVPLSDELGGSLRTLIPKGNDVKSLSRNFDGAGKSTKRNHTNKKKGQHPHRAPNLKWIPRIRGPSKHE